MFRFACRLLAASVLLASPLAATAQDDPFALLFGEEDQVDVGSDDRPGEDDVRFIGLRLGGLKLTETITGYERPGGLCVVAEDLFTVLDAPIRIEDGQASGWFLAPERTISVDFPAASARVGTVSAIDISGQAFETPAGWCLTEAALSRLLPIDFSYLPASLTLQMEPRETLPLQARLEREALRARLDASAGRVRPNYRRVDNPYRWLSFPTADISLDLRAASDGALTSDAGIEFAGDVLWTTARVRSAGDGNGGMGLRVSFDRVFDGGQTGWMPRQVRIGDVAASGQPLISRGETGRGLIVTNRPAYRAEVFDTTDIRGALPAGWEAELYRDGQLLDFVTEPDAQGEYAFNEVEILPGYNRYQVRHYGPFGEIETRDVTFFAGSEMRPENEVEYEFALIEEGVTVDGAETGMRRQLATAAALAFGISHILSARVDGRASADGDASGVLSLIGAHGDTHGVIRLAGGNSGGAAFEGRAVHLFRDRSSLKAGYVWFGDQELTGQGQAERLRQSIGMEYDTLLPVTAWGLPLQSALRWDETRDGDQRLAASARLASIVRSWRWTHVARFERLQTDTGSSSSLGGNLGLSRNLAGLRLRAGMTYDLHPEARLSSLDVALQKRLDRGGFAQLSLSREMGTGRTQAGASYSREFGDFALTGSGGLDSDGSWSAGLKLSTSLFFDRRSGAYRTAQTGLARSGAIRASVFDDLDDDGRLGVGDRPIKGASFILDRSIRREETDVAGGVVLTGAGLHRPLDLELSLGSLDDPFLQPREAGLSISVRPGQVVDVDAPLTLTGEVEASVILMNGDTPVPVAGVTVQAVNRDGAVVASATSEYDGYVYLGALPMGEFTVEVAAEALDAIEAGARGVEVELTRDAPSAFGVSLTIHRNSPPESTDG